MREKEKYNREILDLIRSMQNIDFITPEDIPVIIALSRYGFVLKVALKRLLVNATSSSQYPFT